MESEYSPKHETLARRKNSRNGLSLALRIILSSIYLSFTGLPVFKTRL